MVNLRMMLRAVVTLCSDSRGKHISTLCGLHRSSFSTLKHKICGGTIVPQTANESGIIQKFSANPENLHFLRNTIITVIIYVFIQLHTGFYLVVVYCNETNHTNDTHHAHTKHNTQSHKKKYMTHYTNANAVHEYSN
jgi:hypothetical protein